jgi:hypothetical protein
MTVSDAPTTMDIPAMRRATCDSDTPNTIHTVSSWTRTTVDGAADPCMAAVTT